MHSGRPDPKEKSLSTDERKMRHNVPFEPNKHETQNAVANIVRLMPDLGSSQESYNAFTLAVEELYNLTTGPSSQWSDADSNDDCVMVAQYVHGRRTNADTTTNSMSREYRDTQARENEFRGKMNPLQMDHSMGSAEKEDEG